MRRRVGPPGGKGAGDSESGATPVDVRGGGGVVIVVIVLGVEDGGALGRATCAMSAGNGEG